MTMLILTGLVTTAQQDPLVSQHLFNKVAINPAYTGARNATSFIASYRKQWTSIDDAPQTAIFSVHSPLKRDKVALGFTVMNDRLGIISSTGMCATYAYRLPVGEGKLSMGLQTGIIQYKIETASAKSNDPGDPLLQADVRSWVPDVGAGIYYYHKYYYFGASAMHLTRSGFISGKVLEIDQSRQWRHYYAMGGGRIDLNEDFKLRPTLLLKYVENAPFQAEIDLTALMLDRLWLGVNYRTSASVNFHMAMNAKPNLQIGYSYDMVTNGLGAYTGGSHEVFILFDLIPMRTGYRTTRNFDPRFF
jgi:type IX secretion system PorP/SprF family membrane protein